MESVKFSTYLFIVLAFSLIFVLNASEFARFFNIVLYVKLLLFSVSILIYFWLTYYYEGADLHNVFRELETRKSAVNTLFAFAFPEYGGAILRFNGYNLDPNFWGMYALFSFWFLLSLGFIANYNGYNYSKKLFNLVFCLSFLSLILTFSRGAYLAFLVSALIYYISSFSMVRIFKLLFFLLVLFGVILFLYMHVEVIRTAVDLKLFSGDVSNNPRFEKWSFYLGRIIFGSFHDSIFGVGLIDLFTWFNGTTMHNTYLQISTSLGVLGFFVFVIIVVLGILSCLRTPSQELMSANMAMIMAMLVSILFIDMMYAPVLWIGLTFPVVSTQILIKVQYDEAF
jgi:O-antigen ligase